MRRVLVVDDELAHPSAGVEFAHAYSVDGFEFEFAASLDQAIRKLASGPTPALVLLDIRFEGRGDTHGLDVLQELHRRNPRLPVVMMSSRQDPDVLIRSWDLGALSYIVKWSDNKRFAEELAEKVKKFALYESSELIIGSSPPIRRLRDTIRTVAGRDATILIEGETGTGKQLVAQSIHLHGKRASGPFIEINCATIPETLVESTLFGHKRGAFTGAVKDQKGSLEEAHGGILFLDEVGELKLNIQATLLKFLDSGQFSRVGEAQARTVNVQVVAATNRNLAEEARAGRFREDLYYRLNDFPIHTPALRDRKEDIPLLAEHFLELNKNKRMQSVSGFSSEVIEIFLHYRWPGNIRELMSAVHYAYIMTPSGQIEPKALKSEFFKNVIKFPSSPLMEIPDDLDLNRYLSMITWSVIRRIYEQELNRGMYGIGKRVAKRAGLNPVNGFRRKIDQITKDCPELISEVKEILKDSLGKDEDSGNGEESSE
jgi:DNA-binding NtrC family response regulator